MTGVTPLEADLTLWASTSCVLLVSCFSTLQELRHRRRSLPRRRHKEAGESQRKGRVGIGKLSNREEEEAAAGAGAVVVVVAAAVGRRPTCEKKVGTDPPGIHPNHFRNGSC